MKMLHSYWAFIVLAMLLIAIVNAIVGLTAKKSFMDKDLRLSLFALIVTHIQFLIGVILYISQGRYQNIGEVMGVKEARLLALEHPVMMILAIVLNSLNSLSKIALRNS